MAFKSEAQKRKFKQLVEDGLMTKETFEKWASEEKTSTSTKLPERIKPKKMKIKVV